MCLPACLSASAQCIDILTYLLYTWLKYMESATNSRWMRKDEMWKTKKKYHTFSLSICFRRLDSSRSRNSGVIFPWECIANNALEWNCRDTEGVLHETKWRKKEKYKQVPCVSKTQSERESREHTKILRLHTGIQLVNKSTSFLPYGSTTWFRLSY